jgi:Protein of unknown function (DUF3145)
MSGTATCGVVFVHSAPAALCPHVQWAIAGVLDTTADLDWIRQPAEPGSWRTELTWRAPVGTGPRLASAQRGWDRLRFEVTEDAAPGSDGARWSHTPALGTHHAVIGAHGDALLGEGQVRSALAGGDLRAVTAALEQALGAAWDAELEPFRYAGDGAPVRWLHRVG